MNRGNCRMDVFQKPGDFAAFVTILEEGRQRVKMRILAYCLMNNHWHIVLWPRKAGDLSKFVQWISSTHVRRWREHRANVGQGHLYQGRFKAFPVQSDPHLLGVFGYVEANPLRARMVRRAQDWQWSSLGGGAGVDGKRVQLAQWPPRPAGRMGRAGQCHGGQGRARSTPVVRPAQPAIRRRRLGAADGAAAGLGINAARSVAAKEAIACDKADRFAEVR
jgi:REP element-mobilizing transposase RayT